VLRVRADEALDKLVLVGDLPHDEGVEVRVHLQGLSGAV
jgi:hypothetical protein